MQLSIQTHKTIRGHTWHQSTWNDIGQKPELASKTASSVGIPIAVHIIVSTASKSPQWTGTVIRVTPFQEAQSRVSHRLFFFFKQLKNVYF